MTHGPGGFPGMLRFDVFGRLLGVARDGNRWQLYDLSNPAGRRTVPNISIPNELQESELPRFLADLFHESARPDRPDVRRL